MESAAVRAEDHEPHLDRGDLVRIGLVALAVAVSWLLPWQPFLEINAVALTATLLGGYPIYKEAFEAFRERRMTMELSMTIALVAALSIREAFTAVVIVLFVLVAELLEHMTVGRGRRAIHDLLDLLPRTVAIRRPEGVTDVAASVLAVGDVVVIRPGGRVPVDGVVESGHSFVDQSAITGESLPTEKVPGASVFAGTINQSGALDVRTTGIGPDTTFAKNETTSTMGVVFDNLDVRDSACWWKNGVGTMTVPVTVPSALNERLNVTLSEPSGNWKLSMYPA